MTLNFVLISNEGMHVHDLMYDIKLLRNSSSKDTLSCAKRNVCMSVSLPRRQWPEELREAIVNDHLRSLLIALSCLARGKWKMDFQSENCRISS